MSGGRPRTEGKDRTTLPASETFLEELSLDGVPSSVEELARRAEEWVERRVHRVAHRTTGVPPSERFEVEARLLKPRPQTRFDTAYVEVRKVHQNVPLFEYGAVRYSVPPDLCGQTIEIRREVGSETFMVRWAGRIIVTHQIAAKATVESWDPEHRRLAERAALVRHRRPARTVASSPAEPPPLEPERLALDGDYDVGEPDLGRYQLGAQGPQIPDTGANAAGRLSPEVSEKGESR